MENEIEGTEVKTRWILTHDSHSLKKGDIYEGVTLPSYLAGKVVPAVKAVQRSPDEMLEIDALREDITTLSEELTDTKSLLKQKSGEVKSLVVEMDTLQKENNELRQDNAELQAQLKGKKG